jgi:hypothetical protein
METNFVPTNQAWEERRSGMIKIIQSFNKPIVALEIGSWFGEGSTQIWLNNLKPFSQLTLIDAWKPYASKSDLGDGGFGYSAMDSMATDAFLSTFINVKKFQNSNASKNIAVNIVRGESKFFLQQLSECFDFIYIDGDHKYDAVKSDLQQAKRIIKKNDSIICGDDLERLPSESLIELSRMHTDKDYIRDQSFHPGVLLAVAEEFGTVNMFNGFWWIYCRNGVFSIT